MTWQVRTSTQSVPSGTPSKRPGDAGETLEELMWLILSQLGHDKALRLLDEQFHPMSRGEMAPDEAFKRVTVLMNSYLVEERIITS